MITLDTNISIILTRGCLCFLLLSFLHYWISSLRSQKIFLLRCRRVCQLLLFNLVYLLGLGNLSQITALQRHCGVVLGHMFLLLRRSNSPLDHLTAEPRCLSFLLSSRVFSSDTLPFARSIGTCQSRCFRVVSVVVGDVLALKTCATRWKLPLAPDRWLWC